MTAWHRFHHSVHRPEGFYARALSRPEQLLEADARAATDGATLGQAKRKCRMHRIDPKRTGVGTGVEGELELARSLTYFPTFAAPLSKIPVFENWRRPVLKI
jgi:hypothetical protein